MPNHTPEDQTIDLIARYLSDENSPGLHEPDLDHAPLVIDPRLAADEIVQILLDQGWERTPNE